MSRREALRSLCAAAVVGPIVRKSAEDDAHSASPVASRDIDERALSALVERLLHQSHVPGLAITIIDGDAVWTRGFGFANRYTGARVTEDTVFQAASLTKPAFAYVVLKLAQDGRLGLDIPLVHYLPALRISPNPAAERITARMALSHSSGLPLNHFPKWPERLEELEFAPGARFGYSGAAYIYLQQAVEEILGEPLEGIMRRRFLDPLGLEGSSFVWRPEYEERVSLAHDWDGSPVKEKERSRPAKANAAGSLHTTTAHFARYMSEGLFKEPENEFAIDPVHRGMMVSPQMALTSHLAWGLGWGIRCPENGDRFWHWGDSRGFMNYAVGAPAEKRGLVVFTNGRHGLRVCERVARFVMGDGEEETFCWIYDEFYKKTGQELPALPPENAAPPKVTPHKARKRRAR